MNTSGHAVDGTPDVNVGRTGSRRFLFTAIGFVAFEALLIGALGDYFYADNTAAFWMWGMVALATAGYFALGYFSGSWKSAALLAAPLLVAVAIGTPGPVVAHVEGATVSIRENVDLDQLWLILSLVFLPAWALGVLTTVLRSRHT